MEDDKLLVDKKTANIVRSFIPAEEALDGIADFFSSLSDQTRIKIVSALSITPLCVSDLSTLLSLNQTTVSHSLKNLKGIGVVKCSRQGKVSFYSLKNNGILDIMLSAVNFI